MGRDGLPRARRAWARASVSIRFCRACRSAEWDGVMVSTISRVTAVADDPALDGVDAVVAADLPGQGIGDGSGLHDGGALARVTWQDEVSGPVGGGEQGQDPAQAAQGEQQEARRPRRARASRRAGRCSGWPGYPAGSAGRTASRTRRLMRPSQPRRPTRTSSPNTVSRRRLVRSACISGPSGQCAPSGAADGAGQAGRGCRRRAAVTGSVSAVAVAWLSGGGRRGDAGAAAAHPDGRAGDAVNSGRGGAKHPGQATAGDSDVGGVIAQTAAAAGWRGGV